MRNLERRLRKLEGNRDLDPSGFSPHSPEWLAFWQRQFHLYETGQEHVPLTLEGVRAVMQATPDNGDEVAVAP
jgi:hypothetical protein